MERELAPPTPRIDPVLHYFRERCTSLPPEGNNVLVKNRNKPKKEPTGDVLAVFGDFKGGVSSSLVLK